MLVKDAILLKCGHTANAEVGDKPVCAICYGLRKGWDEPVDELPNLEGREARCGCGKVKPSSLDLPFFEYCPRLGGDRFYCGCKGWD